MYDVIRYFRIISTIVMVLSFCGVSMSAQTTQNTNVDTAVVGTWLRVNDPLHRYSVFGMNIHSNGKIDLLGVDFRTGRIAIRPIRELYRLEMADSGKFRLRYLSMWGGYTYKGPYYLRGDSLIFKVADDAAFEFIRTELGKQVTQPIVYHAKGIFDRGFEFEASQIAAVCHLEIVRLSPDWLWLYTYDEKNQYSMSFELYGVTKAGEYIFTGSNAVASYRIDREDYSFHGWMDDTDTLRLRLDTLDANLDRISGSIRFTTSRSAIERTESFLDFSAPVSVSRCLTPINIFFPGRITTADSIVNLPLAYGVGLDNGTFFSSVCEIRYDTSLLAFHSIETQRQVLDGAIRDVQSDSGRLRIRTSMVGFSKANDTLLTLRLKVKRISDSSITHVRIDSWLFDQGMYLPWTGNSTITLLPSGTVGVELNPGMLERLVMDNHPNPFDKQTTITYELPRSSHVRLIVYDVLGRDVEVLVHEQRTSGLHHVNFDAVGLPDGMYFYRLESSAGMEVGRMVVRR